MLCREVVASQADMLVSRAADAQGWLGLTACRACSRTALGFRALNPGPHPGHKEGAPHELHDAAQSAAAQAAEAVACWSGRQQTQRRRHRCPSGLHTDTCSGGTLLPAPRD